MDYEKKFNEAMLRADEAVQKGCLDKDMFDIIFPPEESEDERIRKAIVLGIKRCADAGSIFGTVINNEGVNYHDVLAWLEKQKEPEPKEPGYKHEDYFCERCQANAFNAGRESVLKEQKPELVQQPPITYTYNANASRDERLKAALLALLNSDLIKVQEGGYFTKQDLIEWVEQKPSWSEEDEKMMDSILNELGQHYKACTSRDCPSASFSFKAYQKEINWLKSLRPSWRPSEEQMEALAYASQILDDGLSPKAAKAGEELEHLRKQLKKL